MYVLLTLFAAIALSGCSTFHAITLVRGGASHVRADEETVVPFQLSGHIILVKGRINNSSRDYTFMLDTGALSVIGKDVADKLGLAEDVAVEMRAGCQTGCHWQNTGVGGLEWLACRPA